MERWLVVQICHFLLIFLTEPRNFNLVLHTQNSLRVASQRVVILPKVNFVLQTTFLALTISPITTIQVFHKLSQYVVKQKSTRQVKSAAGIGIGQTIGTSEEPSVLHRVTQAYGSISRPLAPHRHI